MHLTENDSQGLSNVKNKCLVFTNANDFALLFRSYEFDPLHVTFNTGISPNWD